MTWAIYGANGFTGSLIAAEAHSRGERPVLLGRSAERLQPLAEQLGLPFGEVTDQTLAKTVRAFDLVVNAAGPFAATTAPVLSACIAAGAHYVDISNELESVQYVYREAARVRAVGITAVAAAGFGTVVTDAVAARVVSGLPGAVAVEVAIFPDNRGSGVGTSASTVGVLGDGAVRLVDGLIQRAPLGRGIKRIATPIGHRSLVPIASGDTVTVRRTTGMRTITASVGFAAPVALLTASLPLVANAARRGLVRSLPESKPKADHVFASYAWARATDAAGDTLSGWLSTGEGYAFTATSTVNAVLGILANPLAGVETAASVLGNDFALSVPGTRIDLLDDRGRIDPWSLEPLTS